MAAAFLVASTEVNVSLPKAVFGLLQCNSLGRSLLDHDGETEDGRLLRYSQKSVSSIKIVVNGNDFAVESSQSN